MNAHIEKLMDLGRISLTHGLIWSSRVWDFIADNDLLDFTVTSGTGMTVAGGADKNHGTTTLTWASTSTDNAVAQLQVESEHVLFEAGKEYWAFCKFNVATEGIQHDLWFGWGVTDADPVNGVPTDCMVVKNDDGDLVVDLYVTNDTGTGSDAATGVSAIVLATEYVWSLCYKAKTATAGTLYFYENGVLKGELECTHAPDTEVAVFFNSTQGATDTARVVTVDYIGFASQR